MHIAIAFSLQPQAIVAVPAPKGYAPLLPSNLFHQCPLLRSALNGCNLLFVNLSTA